MDANPFSGFGLQSVSLNDRARFESYFQNLAEPLSDYTFAQLYTWGNSLRILWTEIDRHLCVFANGTGDLTLLIPPVGGPGGDGPGGRRRGQGAARRDREGGPSPLGAHRAPTGFPEG